MTGMRGEHPWSGSELTIRAATLLLKGVPPKDVASDTGLNVRTLYRWRKGLRSLEFVTVDGWTATFARFRYRPPVRISAWERGTDVRNDGPSGKIDAAGVSGNHDSATMRDGAASGAYSTGCRAVAFSPGVRR